MAEAPAPKRARVDESLGDALTRYFGVVALQKDHWVLVQEPWSEYRPAEDMILPGGVLVQPSAITTMAEFAFVTTRFPSEPTEEEAAFIKQLKEANIMADQPSDGVWVRGVDTTRRWVLPHQICAIVWRSLNS